MIVPTENLSKLIRDERQSSLTLAGDCRTVRRNLGIRSLSLDFGNALSGALL